ncbi:MAG: CoA transferase [Chloroflexi bacterium]|nr:CoA transferase [Chloroflexota bacterium]
MGLPPPLAGIRVIEVGNYMAGPFCGLQLADLGADVVKVENPAGGDLTRSLAPFDHGESGSFVRLNRGKRGVALDLKHPEGVRLFKALAATADVIVENLRPGTMRDLGLDPQVLLAASPRLIYVAVSGWGQDGPYADRPALDIIVQGMSGLMSVTGEVDGVPVKVGVSVADLTAGLYATIATLAALRARDRDGLGQLVDLSMLESAVSLAQWEAGQFFTDGRIPERAGSAHRVLAPYQAIRSSDGHFIVGATTPRNWTGFCRALGLEALEHDPRFAEGNDRRRQVDALIPLIEAVTGGRPMAHWLERLRTEGVPCGEIADYKAVFTDPHLVARGFFTDLRHPTIGTVHGLGTPLRLTGTPPRLQRAGPLLGEHTAEVLAELGLGRAEIDALAARGTVRLADDRPTERSGGER